MLQRAMLLGAGHAHLFTLKRAAEFARHGFELVLVAPEVFWYSGLATGVLAGIYPPELDQIDVGALVVKGGGRFIRARATAIDVAARTVSLDTGSSLSYDVLSCNLGSEVPLDAVPANYCRRVAASNPGATRTVRPSTSTTSRALAWAGTASATTCTGTRAAFWAARRFSTRRQLQKLGVTRPRRAQKARTRSPRGRPPDSAATPCRTRPGRDPEPYRGT
jgi:hypothetical protein